MSSLKNKPKYLAYLGAVGIFAIAFGMMLGILFHGKQSSTNVVIESSPSLVIEETPYLPEETATETEVVTDQYIENGLIVSRSDFGKEWPLVVDSGILKCEPLASRPELSLVTFESEGITYAVNGLARGTRAEQNGWSDIEEIWKDDPEMQGYKINIGTFIDHGLEICDQ